MNEYEKIFTENVWNRLKQKIKGKIFVGIRDNILKVSVKCDEIYFEKFVENVAEKIVTGELNCESLSLHFESEYRSYVKEQTEKRLFY